MKIRIAKFQGPIDPPRYQEPPQIVQEVPPLDLSKMFPETPADEPYEDPDDVALAFLNEGNNYGQ